MADVNTVNPLAWNFSAFDYLTPTELRSGNSMPYSFNPSLFNTSSNAGLTNTGTQLGTNPFGNYSSLGMNGLFGNVGSLCSLSDAFTTQTAPMIAQAKAYNDQLFNQGLYQAQQTSALRDQLKALGINPDSVLNQNQLSGTTANTSTNSLSSILGLLGLGGTTETTKTVDDWWNHTGEDNSDDSDDSFWDYIDSKVAQSRQKNQMQILLNSLNETKA